MLEPADRLKVISRVKAIVVKHHFNIGNVDYADWSRAVDEQIPTLLTADDNTFEEGVRSLLCQLKSSHTNFYRSDTNPTMPQHVIGATLRSVPRDGAPQWMFLDVFEDGPAARAGISPGHLLISVNGTPAIPPSFSCISLWPRTPCDDRTTRPEGSQEHRVDVFHRREQKGDDRHSSSQKASVTACCGTSEY